MIMFRFFWIAVAAAVVCSCSRAELPAVVNHSYSRPDQVRVEHIDLDLTVDFERERLVGTATLQIRNITGATELYLDSYELDVDHVTLEGSEEPRFRLSERQGYLGQALIIPIRPDSRRVTVHYSTTREATALDWLKPEQTVGRKHPFLFTQGQAILNRSWIPCQDTPAVRITYNATIRTAPNLLAVMSAGNPQQRSADGVYRFSMPQPIAPYLIALAVGDLEFRSISDRCGVYAEPGMIDRAAWEFADTEKMIQSAEALYGPYRWERYDVIVLPPSFPFGGMENPRLSFVTPVLLAGDRSLVSTIAHELAHSWSGNLVTNETWEDFWINEGFTTYFERRIVEALYGAEYMEMQALLGFRELAGILQDMGSGAPETVLRPQAHNTNPDDGISTVPYEKGYLFLRLIEETVGRTRWDAFLKTYFETFAFQTMTTERFTTYLREDLVDEELARQLEIRAWLYEPGLPANHPVIHSAAFERVHHAAEAWLGGAPPERLDTEGWSAQEWKEFLQELPDSLPAGRMAELDEAFHLTQGTNGELLQVWFLQSIASGYKAAYPRVEEFLVGLGRIWLIEPLYRRMAATPDGLERARAIYRRARPGYHKLTVAVIDRVLRWEPEREGAQRN